MLDVSQQFHITKTIGNQNGTPILNFHVLFKGRYLKMLLVISHIEIDCFQTLGHQIVNCDLVVEHFIDLRSVSLKVDLQLAKLFVAVKKVIYVKSKLVIHFQSSYTNDDTYICVFIVVFFGQFQLNFFGHTGIEPDEFVFEEYCASLKSIDFVCMNQSDAQKQYGEYGSLSDTHNLFNNKLNNKGSRSYKYHWLVMQMIISVSQVARRNHKLYLIYQLSYLQRLLSFIVTVYMQPGHNQEQQQTHQQLRTFKIEQQIAIHSNKRQGAGMSESLRTCLSRIEDSIFQQANQIAIILQDQQSVKIDGYAYSAIQQYTQLCMQLQKVRMNAPIYQNMSNKKKKKFFQKLGTDYCLSLSNKKIENDQQKHYFCNEETHEISQNSIIKERKFGKKIKKSHVSKINLISELSQDFEQAKAINECDQFKTPKKVCFLTESSKKYFAKQEAVQTVSIQRTYLFSTLDKL